MSGIQKFGGMLRISDESLWSMRGGDYQRHAEIVRGPVTPEIAAAHTKAVEALAYLRNHPDYIEGGPDYESENLPLRPAEHIVFTETHDEWAARCQELDRRRT